MIAATLDDAAFEFEYLERPLERPLQWGGLLIVVAAVLPIRIDAGEVLWPWQILADRSALIGTGLQLTAGLLFIALSFAAGVPKLTRALWSLVLLGAASFAVLRDADLSAALMPFVPASLHASGLFIMASFICAGTALKFSHGPRDDSAAAPVVRTFVIAGLLAVVAAYAWPHGIGSLGSSIARTFWAALTRDFALQIRFGLILVASVGLLPGTIVAVATVRAMRSRRPGYGSVSWVIGLFPAMLLALGIKAAATFGADVAALLALRSSLLMVASALVAIFAITAALSQVLDPWVESGPHTRRLLRDELLYRILSDGGERALERVTDGFRPQVRKLVQSRLTHLQSSLKDVLPNASEPHREACLRLSLCGVSDDELQSIRSDDLAEAQRTARRPAASGLSRLVARGRRLEILAGLSLVVVVSTWIAIDVAMTPKTPPWRLESAPQWATDLYATKIPRFVIEAQWARGDEADRTAFDGAVREAVEAARPNPRLAEALTRLAALSLEPGANRRELRRVQNELNEIAREAGLPLYLDVNVRGRRLSRWDVHWLYYIKSYRIVRFRKTTCGSAQYGALWVERIDRTNVVETNLGYKKLDQPYGMVLLDVLARHWRDDLAPALAGTGDEDGLASIYSEHREPIIIDLVAASDDGEVIRADLRCREEQSVSPSCLTLGPRAQSAAVEALAEKVEMHELQHVIDGESIKPPDVLRALMAGYTEDALFLAAAELSAYLAEMARSRQPRLALAHLIAVGSRAPNTAEAHAAAIAFVALDAEDPALLLSLSPGQLRDRARQAYADLFGAPPPELVVEDASGTGERYPPARGRT